MPRVAFLSIEQTDGWFIDDDLVHSPLSRLGWEAQNIPWDSPEDWNSFDMVVIRSPWDYQSHLDRFLNVLDAIEHSSAILVNTLEIVRWNINKNYLFQLKDNGVELLPTLKVYNPNLKDVNDAFSTLDTNELIIKPIIGANADDTYRLKKGESESFSKILAPFKDREGIIQAFERNILKEGEFSVMYFNGKRMHTVLKTVGKNDFRVQEEHGGGVLPIPDPEKKLISVSNRVMSSLPFTPLYARVDLVRTPADSFALMELELIEPCLYFRFDEEAPRVFAEAIDSYWSLHKSDLQ